MSEIKERIDKWLDNNHLFTREQLASFIESNYIPKEEHERLKIQFGTTEIARDAYWSEIQKLKEENVLLESTLQNSQHNFSELAIVNLKIKEENERLKGQVNISIADIAGTVRELLRQQRESCVKVYKESEDEFGLAKLILNAPSPRIDLNK